MKNGLIILICLSLFACAPSGDTGDSEQEAVSEPQPERSIGFTRNNDEWKYHLGTEEAIEVVMNFDKEWTSRNYEGMKDYFTDTTWFMFANGNRASNPEEFLNIIRETDGNISWEATHAFSVDYNPEIGGEHVQAGFLVTTVSDEGDTTRSHYNESYYVIEGKIIHWRQWQMKLNPPTGDKKLRPSGLFFMINLSTDNIKS